MKAIKKIRTPKTQGLILYFIVKKHVEFISWLKITLILLFADLVLLDIFGLTVYIPYRAEGGPRTILKASEATAWLHGVVFEHKEFLAFAPPLIILVAFIVTETLGKKLNNENVRLLRKSVIFSFVASIGGSPPESKRTPATTIIKLTTPIPIKIPLSERPFIWSYFTL